MTFRLAPCAAALTSVLSSLLLVLLARVAVGQYASENIELLSRVPLDVFGTNHANDLWGWTDPVFGREYALVGLNNGTGFVDVTNPNAPAYLGKLPSHSGVSNWRDIKVYQDHAYIVADEVGPHGLQVFDLRTLRGVTSPRVFGETAHSDAFRSAHNIAINESTGFAYVPMTDVAAGSLVFDLANPTSPSMVGVVPGGTSHDLQVVTYHGPDAQHAGREILFGANIARLSIVDVTDKQSMSILAERNYPGVQYAHQGWLSEDHRYYYMNDELDDAWTHIWDVRDLDNPIYVGGTPATADGLDHNSYVKGNLLYSANYSVGLHVFDLSNAPSGSLTEVGYIDTFPDFDGASFRGAWSVYPFFDSGTILVNDTNGGLFVTRLDFGAGDFNNDGTYDCDDINALVVAIYLDSSDPQYDLSGDGNVNLTDRDIWLAEAGQANLPNGAAYSLGDANLDGVVDGLDFVVWNENKFSIAPFWCSGDFNADGVVDGLDSLIWNQHSFTSGNIVVIPEPQTMVLLLLALVAFARLRWT